MKKFFLITVFLSLIFGHAQAQNVLSWSPWQCKDGQQKYFISIVPNHLRLKFDVQLQEEGQPLILKCLVNSVFHHSETVTASGERVVDFDSLNTGAPDYNVNLSLWQGGAQVSNVLSIGQMFPWAFAPVVSIDTQESEQGTLNWDVGLSNFSVPVGDAPYAGCFEYKFLCVLEPTDQNSSEILRSDTIVLSSGSITPAQTIGVFYEHEGPVTTVCLKVKLIRQSSHFETTVVSVTEGGCMTAEEMDITTGISDSDAEVGPLSAFPNPFTEQLTVRGIGQYVIYQSDGKTLCEGNSSGLTVIQSSGWSKGTYYLHIRTPNGEKVQKLIRE